MTGNRLLLMLLGIIIIASIGYASFFIVRPVLFSPDEKKKVLMCGRSTMMLWFKHWNWPYPLRIKATYKNWPISYDKFVKGNLYLEYLPVPAPTSRSSNEKFGIKMVEALDNRLNNGKYDAVFFKFCFVDFMTDEDKRAARFDDMTKVINDVYALVTKKGSKLILGNALPLLDSNDATIKLQKDYNAWLAQFASAHKDVLVFELYSPLAQKDGKLALKFARSADDSHPRDNAYSVLDKTFFPQVEGLLNGK